MFRLVRFFAVANAIALIGVAVILYGLYRQTAVDEMLRTTEQHNAALARTFANALSAMYDDRAVLGGSPETDSAGESPVARDIDQSIRSLVRGLQVIKVVIYDAEANIVYSSDEEELGGVGADDPAGFEIALGGVHRSEIEFRPEFQSLNGPLKDRYVIETYAPFIGKEGATLGVFELYSDVTDRMQTIEKISAALLVGLFAAFSLLYAGLLLAIRRANRIITGQYRQLEESRSTVHAKNEELLAEITQRNQAEAELRLAREEAEEASRTKSRFLANMSHELRTPLNAVIGFSEVIADQMLGDVKPTRYREYASDIRESGKRLLSLVDDILDLSRVEAGTARTKIEAFEVAAVVRSAARTVESECRRNGNELLIDCPDDTGEVISDKSKIISIVTNLLANAAKFTKSGRIEVTVRRGPDVRWITIEITDTGIGMETDRVDEMFGEFTQHDSSISRDYGGTGLGLSIAHRYCEMLGGEISMHSEIGQGTGVTVRLPTRLDIAGAERAAE